MYPKKLIDPNIKSTYDLGSINFDPEGELQCFGLKDVHLEYAGNVQTDFGNVEFDTGIAEVNIDEISEMGLNFEPDLDGVQKDFFGHIVISDEEDYSDSSSDDVYYSDHSYQEEDDDGLYETFC